jgi:hypothetical protein
MRNLHSVPAAAAMGLVLCLAGFSFVMFSILTSGEYASQILPITDVRNCVRHIGAAAGLVILLGYAAGMLGWLVIFALRRDGKHRVEELFRAFGRG